MKLAVVGHVEWGEFARVDHVPAPGEIVEALEAWEQPAGGGAVAAVQIARLAGGCLFFTALGDDELGHRAQRELEDMGVRVEAAWRTEPQRLAFVHLSDALPWSELEAIDAVYLTAGDAGAVRAARAAGRLVATVRAGEALAGSRVQLDVLVMSANDAAERCRAGEIEPPPLAVVRTDGAAGGWIETADRHSSRWTAPALPAPAVDTYGAGDSFAGGLTFGLGQGQTLASAVALGARCGAACVSVRGPYARQPAGSERA